MDLKGIFIITIFISCTTCEEPPILKFHEYLTTDELSHYFGDITNVPTYEYTDPQPIDRRKRRDTGSSGDDNLEYSFNAFGETYHLLLEKNNDLVSPGCVVQRFKPDGTRQVAPCSIDHADCYFTGTSSNHSDSWVAASVCGGLHGVVGTGEKTLIVQPIKARHMSRAKRETRLQTPHIVYIHKQHKRSCDTVKHSQEKRDIEYSLADVKTSTKSRKRRRRRELTSQYLETAVVADQSSVAFHKEETEQVLKTIMNIAAHRLMDPTFGARLFVVVNKIVIMEHDQDLHVVNDSALLLNNLCTWQKNWNPSDDTSPDHADYVLLLTKKNLVFKGNQANSGLARMGVCGRNGGCSINEDSGLGAGLTIAHETGHVLGMRHDHDGNQCANGVNIMSSMAPNGPNAFKWSRCSANVVQTFLHSEKSTCLNDHPPGSAVNSFEMKVKPGTLYTANKQCKLMLGHTAEVCADVAPKGLDVCGGLVCRKEPNSGVNGCAIYGMPRMDGTDCSKDNTERKWCLKGTCIAMGPSDPAPVNGGWSDWEEEYRPCSRSCGGGVKVKLRYCNNPEPIYGGKQCVGQSMIGELCNVQPCPTSQFEFMAQQCAATDSRQLRGRNYHWVPNQGATGDASCNVNCNAEGTNWISKRGISVDGTQCIQNTPATFSRCVVGQCKDFGCDGRMRSGFSYDQCGLCNGKGDTCKKLSGTFTGGKAKEYTTFVTIPAGSTGISITEGNVYCSLSVRISGETLFDAGTPKKSGMYERGGVTIKYQSRPERLEIVGPVKTPVEAQVYRKYGPPYVGVDPDVYYEYHTPLVGQTQSYQWNTKPGKCSKPCGTGHQTPIIICEGTLGTVEDYHCSINDKPAEVQNECNTHACPPRWRDSEWSQCSATCGGGTQTRSVECVQENREVEAVVSERMCQGMSKPSASAACNTDKCPGTWKPGGWSGCSETCARGLKTRDVKCYASASSTTPISDSNCVVEDKPEVNEACMIKPCRMDIKGDACTDKKPNCFKAYGEDICTNQYKTWAHNNCMKSCGVCAENPGDYNPNCKDVITNCAQYSTGFCTNSAYMAWAKKNCQKFCGYCEAATTTTTTTTPASVDENCKDLKNCPAYGQSVCTKYKNWAALNCKKFCKQCDQPKEDGTCVDTADCPAFGTVICSNTVFANKRCRKFCDLCPECKDAITTCNRYGDNMCTKYRGWALKNCKSTCNLCGSRKKRSADYLQPPPPVEDLEPIEADDVYVPVNEVEDVPIVVTEGDVMNDAAEDIEGDLVVPPLIEDDELDAKLPEAPVCNTVRTASRDKINLFEKLEPGVPCEQTIVLPLGKRVLMKFQKLNVDCAAGDVFLIIDGITNDEIPVCNSLLQDEWLSSGSIVSLQFVAGREGHGYAFEYETFEDEINTNIPACSQQLTALHGEVSAITSPHLVGESDETCEVYITATPGDTVELTFNEFNMAGKTGLCEKGKGVLVQDLSGGKEEEFCGKLSPFSWKSNGARVKLTYRQSSVAGGFAVEYTMLDPTY